MEQLLVLLLLLVLPPACLIWMGLALGFCFAIIYSGKNIFRIGNEEIVTKKGTPTALVFSVWGFDLLAWLISFLIVTFTVGNQSFFLEMEAYASRVFVFIVCWDVLYAALLLLSYFSFRKRIKVKEKRRRLFLYFLATSFVLGALSYIAAFSIVG